MSKEGNFTVYCAEQYKTAGAKQSRRRFYQTDMIANDVE